MIDPTYKLRLFGAVAMEHNTANPLHLHVTQGNEDSSPSGQLPEVLDALSASNYERVLNWLRAIGTCARTPDQFRLIQIALQVCLACIHCRSEIEWHDRACREVDKREKELRQGLQTILDTIINAEEGHKPRVEQFSPFYLFIPSLRTQFISMLRRSSGIWKQIQTLLGFQPEEPLRSQDENRLSPLEESNDLIAHQFEVEKPIDHAKTVGEKVTLDEVDEVKSDAPLLVVYCLGTFRVYQNEQSIEDWSSSKSKSIFKYLLTHRERPIVKDVLMDLFWPDADPDSARNNLNVAIYNLRQTLRNGSSDFSHVLFQNDSYQLNPELRLWTDYEAFIKSMLTAQSFESQGDVANALREFTSAEAIYQGEFLEEDRYEDWMLPQRQRLQEGYLELLDRLTRIYYERQDLMNCANMCLKMLAIDPCHEEAHRHLMRCYYNQGQAYLALRQYHICFEALKKELDIAPSKTTRELYEMIRRNSGG